MKNYRVHPNHWLISTQVRATSSFLGSVGGAAVALLPSAVVVTVAPSAVNSLVDSAIACIVLLFSSFWATVVPVAASS